MRGDLLLRGWRGGGASFKGGPPNLIKSGGVSLCPLPNLCCLPDGSFLFLWVPGGVSPNPHRQSGGQCPPILAKNAFFPQPTQTVWRATPPNPRKKCIFSVVTLFYSPSARAVSVPPTLANIAFFGCHGNMEVTWQQAKSSTSITRCNLQIRQYQGSQDVFSLP